MTNREHPEPDPGPRTDAVAVLLTKKEMALGVQLGTRRALHCIFHGKGNYSGDLRRLRDPHAWATFINGACGELAAGKVLRLESGESVGAGLDGALRAPATRPTRTRTTLCPDHGLIIRTEDQMGFYVHVTGVGPWYHVQGFIHRSQADGLGHLEDPGGKGRPCRVIPVARLEPIQDLVDMLGKLL